MIKDDCIFCKLAGGVIPTNSIYEDDKFKVILDMSPATKGHALILPKEHYANIYEMPEELVADAFAGLSSQEQSILILHCVLELPDQEIGRLVGMSRSAVQRRRTKSLSELRIKLMALMPKGG